MAEEARKYLMENPSKVSYGTAEKMYFSEKPESSQELSAMMRMMKGESVVS